MRILSKPIEFEWDAGNTNKNLIKHKVSNKECEDVFTSNRFLLLKDQPHSSLENRYIVIGPTVSTKILKLIITLRDRRVRVISARPASRKERQFYEKTIKNPEI